ncbi:MAG: hypothetical protein ACJ75S_02930 [Solirubrobacterales bacterium]
MQYRLCVDQVLGRERKMLFGLGQLCGDAVLLAFELLQGNRLGVERLQELVALGFERCDALPLARAFPLALFLHLSQHSAGGRTDCRNLLRRECDPLPIAGDLRLDLVGR